MKKTNYEKLLGGYNKIPIDARDFTSLLELETFDLKPLNPQLYSYLKYFEINNRLNLIKEAYINKDGIFFDLTTLKYYLIDFYNLKNDKDLLKNIDELHDKWANNKDYFFDLDSSVVKKIMYEIILPNNMHAFNKYNYIKQDQMYKKFIKDILFYNKTESIENFCEKTAFAGLDCLKEILTNEKNISRVKDVIKEDNLYLYLAYVLYDYAEIFEQKNMKERYDKAINYMSRYIDNNYKLLDEEFSFRNKNITKFEMKYFNVKEIDSYVRINDYRKRLNQDNYVINENNIPLIVKSNFVDFKGNDYKRFLTNFAREINESKASDKANESFNRKMELYKSLNIKGIKKGVDSFEGFLAFILDTGEVLIDRIYDNVCLGKASKNVSIFIVSYKDFELLSRMEKSKALIALRTGNIKNTRITHGYDFEEKVRGHIRYKNMSR